MKIFRPHHEFFSGKFSALMDQTGAFFAFSNEQFAAAKKDGVKYVNGGAGLIIPAENVDFYKKKLAEISEEANTEFLAANDRADIIRYELANYESYYVYDITEAAAALADYGITDRDEILKIFHEESHKYD